MKSFMERALANAKKAYDLGEVPIGAVIIKDGKILSSGYNKREQSKNAINHAEIIAITKACKKIGDWRLDGCEIYVTLEPCPMCAGAILNSRIKKVFYAAKDKTSDDNLFQTIVKSQRLNHNCEFEQLSEYEKTSAELLSKFFKSKRKNTN